MLSVVFVITAPDDLSVWIVAVPDFTAIKGAAVTAYDARSKTTFPAVAAIQAFAPLITLNPMEVKINLRYEEENLHGKSREGRDNKLSFGSGSNLQRKSAYAAEKQHSTELQVLYFIKQSMPVL